VESAPLIIDRRRHCFVADADAVFVVVLAIDPEASSSPVDEEVHQPPVRHVPFLETRRQSVTLSNTRCRVQRSVKTWEG